MVVISCRDRTYEFNHLVKLAQSKNINQTNKNRNLHSFNGSTRSIFLESSQQISEGIYATYVKLEKLGTLCKSKSLFEDHTNEINDLMYTIKMDVTYLKNEIENLSKVMNSETLNQSMHRKNHSKSILTSLERQLATASKDFKNILETRSDAVKIQNERRDHFSKNINIPTLVNSKDLPPNEAMKYRSSSLNTFKNNPMTAINMNNSNSSKTHSHVDSESSINYPSKQQDQLLIVQEAVPTYMQERLNAVQTIESTIVELGGIFQQLAHMVSEQEENIQRIDQNIESTSLHIESAHSELLKYFNSVSSNRWLILKIFGVLFVFILIFVLLS